MTYAFVVGHCQLTLSCDFISIQILMFYVLEISNFLIFVRLYGNIISVYR